MASNDISRVTCFFNENAECGAMLDQAAIKATIEAGTVNSLVLNNISQYFKVGTGVSAHCNQAGAVFVV